MESTRHPGPPRHGHRPPRYGQPLQGSKKSRVLDDQKLSEDNQTWKTDCPPDYEIFFGISFKNSCIHTNSLFFLFSPFLFPTSIYHFGNLKQIAYYMVLIKMMATKNMSRTTRFPILVVLRLPTFDFMHLGSA